VLLSILNTEISPELVPAEPGEKMQSTQDKIGPYNLQDFTLYHVLRRGARPSKIATPRPPVDLPPSCISPSSAEASPSGNISIRAV